MTCLGGGASELLRRVQTFGVAVEPCILDRDRGPVRERDSPPQVALSKARRWFLEPKVITPSALPRSMSGTARSDVMPVARITVA